MNALKSLFGNNGPREQTVFTPERILTPVREVFGGTIAFDPCHGHPGIVLTKVGREVKKREYTGFVDGSTPPFEARGSLVAEGLALAVESLVNATNRTDCDGLTMDWPDGTFCNPPYDKLKDWLSKSLETPTDHVMLVPVRPHRVWWRKWARESEIVYLNAFKFEGHDGAFPGPMCLARRGMTMGDARQLTRLCVEQGLGGTI